MEASSSNGMLLKDNCATFEFKENTFTTTVYHSSAPSFGSDHKLKPPKNKSARWRKLDLSPDPFPAPKTKSEQNLCESTWHTHTLEKYKNPSMFVI